MSERIQPNQEQFRQKSALQEDVKIAVRVGLALGSDPAEFIRAQEAAFGISFYDEPVIREKKPVTFSYEPASRETKSVVFEPSYSTTTWGYQREMRSSNNGK